MSDLRQELPTLARLALPIMATQLAYMATAATDSIMAGHLNAQALAAVALAGAMWVPAATFIGGTLHVLLPLIAGHDAARRDGAAGREGVQGAWLGVLMGAAAGVLLAWGAPAALPRLGVAPALVAPTAGYLAMLAPGMPFFGLWTAARFFCDGHSDTRPAMVTAFGIALLNVPLNLLFMADDPFGLGPGTGLGMGVAGIGLSTAVSLSVGAVGMTARACLGRRYARAALSAAPRRPDPAVMIKLLRGGAPIGGLFLAEHAAFAAVAVFVGGLGPVPLAAHQIALNVVITLFMVPMSIAMAVCIRVGMARGREDAGAERAAIRAGLLLGVGLAGVAAAAIGALGSSVAGLYTPDAAVRGLAVELLALAALFLVLDAVQAVLAAALRGRGDVMVPLAILVGAYWLAGLPVGALLAEAGGVKGWWGGLLAAVGTAAALIAFRAAGSRGRLSAARGVRAGITLRSRKGLRSRS